MIHPEWSDAAICEAFMQDMLDSISLERHADTEARMYEPWGGIFSKTQPVIFIQNIGVC